MVYFCPAWITWIKLDHPPFDLFKIALLRGHGSHSLQIFTSGSGSWCLTYVPLGPSPKKIFGAGAKFFLTPLGSGDMVQTFPGNSPWKEVPKTGFKILGAPPKKLWGEVRISPNFVIFQLFFPFLQNGARYCKSKNGFLIHGHSSTRWWRNGVLRSTKNYVIQARKHPPSDLTASLYTKWLARGRLWRRYSNSTHSRRNNL